MKTWQFSDNERATEEDNRYRHIIQPPIIPLKTKTSILTCYAWRQVLNATANPTGQNRREKASEEKKDVLGN